MFQVIQKSKTDAKVRTWKNDLYNRIWEEVYKDIDKKKRKESENSFDFSEEGLEADVDDEGKETPSPNLWWYNVAKRCIQKKYGNKFNDKKI